MNIEQIKDYDSELQLPHQSLNVEYSGVYSKTIQDYRAPADETRRNLVPAYRELLHGLVQFPTSENPPSF
jgi:hypothetical protein